jgi:hypothetical protein
MTEPDQYLLGYSEAEQDRLERQALELAEDSASFFRQVGLPLRAVWLPVWLTGRAGRCFAVTSPAFTTRDRR